MSNPWDPNAAQPPASPPPGSVPPPPPPPAAPTAPQQPVPAQPGVPQYPTQAMPPGGVPPTDPYAAAPSGGGGGGKGGKIAAGVVGVLLLGGAGAFAMTSMGGGDDGPSSAEDAVQEVLEAVADEDVLGLLGAIDPGERDALEGNVEALLGNLQRIEVLDDSFEATGVDGVDVEIDFDTVTYETEEVREGLTRVYLTEGEIEYSFDPADIPVGDLISDFGGDIVGEDGHGTADFADLDEPFFLVARDTGDDGWRVSIGYTIAEFARFDSGDPDLEPGIEAVGEDSPEAAVEGFLRTLEGDAIDLEDLVARFSPGEFGALQEYLPTFVHDIRETPYYDFEVAIDDIELSADTDGDTALVTLDALDVSLTDGSEVVRFSYDGECVSVDTSDSPSFERELEGTPFEEELCGGDPIDIIEDLGSSVGDVPDLDLEFGTFGITTAQVDGEWYVAPVNTALTALNTFLEPIDRDLIDQFVELGESFFSGSFDDIDLPDPIEPVEPSIPTTTVEVDDDDDYSAIDPDPSLGLSDEDLADIEEIAEYAADDSVCAYELIVTGVVPHEELLRSWREDSAPSDEAAEHLEHIQSVCD